MKRLNRIGIIAIILGLVFTSLIGIIKTQRREILSYKNVELNLATVTKRLDSTIVVNKVNELNLATWEMMNDSLSLRIKDLQKLLNIKNKQLISANAINSELRGKLDSANTIIHESNPPIVVDSVVYRAIDSLDVVFKDKWSVINVHGPIDTLSCEYKIDLDLDIIHSIAYKDAKTKFGKWWNRLWRRGKHEIVTVKSDNPNLNINEIRSIRIHK